MKVIIDGKYRNMSFLSFFKGFLISWFIFFIITYIFFFLVGVFIA